MKFITNLRKVLTVALIADIAAMIAIVIMVKTSFFLMFEVSWWLAGIAVICGVVLYFTWEDKERKSWRNPLLFTIVACLSLMAVIYMMTQLSLFLMGYLLHMGIIALLLALLLWFTSSSKTDNNSASATA